MATSTKPARVITESVNAAVGAGLTITTNAEIGVRCTADAPRWEHDPNARAISCLGAVLLIKQPGIRDYHEALASALGVGLYWHQGFEDGCSGLRSMPQMIEEGADRALYVDGFEVGTAMRELITNTSCQLHRIRYPRGGRCPRCAAGVPAVERSSDRIRVESPRSVIAEIFDVLTVSQVLEAAADSAHDRAGKLPPRQAAELAAIEKTLRELAEQARGSGV